MRSSAREVMSGEKGINDPNDDTNLLLSLNPSTGTPSLPPLVTRSLDQKELLVVNCTRAQSQGERKLFNMQTQLRIDGL